MRNARPCVHNSGTSVVTVLPDEVVVTIAPVVVHVEVVMVCMETPVGWLVSVVVTLSAYMKRTFVLGTPELYATSATSSVMEPCESVTSRANVTGSVGRGGVAVTEPV